MGRKAVKMAEEKKNWLGPYIPQGNILREVVQQIKLLYHLMLDRRVNLLAKLIPVAAVAYIFLPLDFLPDVIPVLGQLDDAAIIMLSVRLFFEAAPPDVVREYLKRLSRPVTEGEWKIMQNSGGEAAPQAPAGELKPESPAASSPEVVEGNFKVVDDDDVDTKPQ